MHGNYTKWFENGKKEIECNYVYGEIHGKYKKWDIYGELEVECMFKHGEMHGRCERWNLHIKCNYNHNDFYHYESS